MKLPLSESPAATASLAMLIASHPDYAVLLGAHERGCRLGEPLLTEAGLVFLSSQSALCANVPVPMPLSVNEDHPGPRDLPCWDRKLRELRLGNMLVKKFLQCAPNQITLLDVFQEDGWPSSIDDPLTPRHEPKATKRHLYETILNLNRAIRSGTMRFHGNGTGQGVYWTDERQDGKQE